MLTRFPSFHLRSFMELWLACEKVICPLYMNISLSNEYIFIFTAISFQNQFCSASLTTATELWRQLAFSNGRFKSTIDNWTALSETYSLLSSELSILKKIQLVSGTQISTIFLGNSRNFIFFQYLRLKYLLAFFNLTLSKNFTRCFFKLSFIRILDSKHRGICEAQ